MFIYLLIMSAILVFCVYKLEQNKAFDNNHMTTQKEMIMYFVYGFGCLFVWYSIGLKRVVIILVVYEAVEFVVHMIGKTDKIDKNINGTETKGK